MPQLPEQTFIQVPVLLDKSQKQDIKKAKDELLYEGTPIKNVLTLMLRVNQIAGRPNGAKFKALIDLVEPMDSFAVFAVHLEEIQAIADHFKCPAIYGGVPAEERHQYIDEFQAGKHRAIVLQYAVGSTGINLDATRNTIFYSHTFNYSHRKQAEGRIARLTQKRNMFYYDLVARGSIDALIARAIAKKQNVSDYVRNMPISSMRRHL
jgi:superfamily II DNA or RNA helicase